MTAHGLVASPWGRSPNRKERSRRPLPSQEDPAVIPDSKVGQYRTLLKQAGIVDELGGLLAGRPGPKGLPLEALFVGIMLSCTYRRGSTNLDDTAEVLATQLTPRARELLGIPELTYDVLDSFASRAAYMRVQRAFDAVTTALDPARHNRRSRVPGDDVSAIRRAWRADRERANQVIQFANSFIYISISKAVAAGALRKWNGDIGIDCTPVFTWGINPRGTGDVLDPHADWYKKGGSKEDDLLWANGLTVGFAGHTHDSLAGQYPRLALGIDLHTPNKDEDRAAINILSQLDKRFQFRRGILALDRGYGDRLPRFYHAVRATGRDLVFDYKSTSLGKQGSTPGGAHWFAGVPVCPHTPTHLLEGAKLLAKDSSRVDKLRGHDLMDQTVAFQFQTKENPTEPGGSHRIQCPAAGPSPTVTCPWAEERDRGGASARKPVPVTIDLTDRRRLRTSPSAMPRVRPPDLPSDERPQCCQRATTTVPPTSNPKYRQKYMHGSTAWHQRYSKVRAQNEGGNGTAKGIDIDISDRKLRLPRGRVAQALMLGIQVMIANLRQINIWARDHKPDDLSACPEDWLPTPTADHTGKAPGPIERPPR